MILHCVAFNFREGVSEAEQQRALLALRALAALPMVSSYRVLANQQPAKRSGPGGHPAPRHYAWVCLASFADQNARDAYAQDATHFEIVVGQVRPLVGEVTSFDVIDPVSA